MRAAARHADAGSSGIISSEPCELRGWSVRSASAATMHLHNGTSATGDLLAAIDIGVNDDHTTMVDVWAPDGIYLEVVAGTPIGAVYFG